MWGSSLARAILVLIVVLFLVISSIVLSSLGDLPFSLSSLFSLSLPHVDKPCPVTRRISSCLSAVFLLSGEVVRCPSNRRRSNCLRSECIFRSREDHSANSAAYRGAGFSLFPPPCSWNSWQKCRRQSIRTESSSRLSTRSLTPRFAQVVEELVEVFTRFSQGRVQQRFPSRTAQTADRTLTFELLGGNMLTVGAKRLHAELARRSLFVMS